MIYFDNSATTPIHPEVVEAMLPYLQEIYGNPSSKYYTQADQAKKAVENARAQVANLLGCDPDEVVFTSGSTESNNMVLKGVVDQYQEKGNHLITTSAEHPSILETAEYLESKGLQVTYLDVDKFARINVERLGQAMSSSSTQPVLVSVIWGNNEVGSLNDVEALAALCKEHGVFFHTDATQTVGKIATNIRNSDINFLSCSAHKLHGPKGIGACVIKKHPLGYKTKITPLMHGGEQENGYRSGTLSVHNIVGFGKAAEIALRDLEDTQKKLLELESYLIERIMRAFPEIVYLNSDTVDKIPGIINLRFHRINNELLLRKLSDRVSLSTGSACSSSKPSHVLQAMGLSLDRVRSSIRVSLSSYNTKSDIDQFISYLTQ